MSLQSHRRSSMSRRFAACCSGDLRCLFSKTGPIRSTCCPAVDANQERHSNRLYIAKFLEETGWTIQNPALLGFVHFHHENPAPPDYAYPHPDFLQLVFLAEAAEQKGTKEPQDEWVVDSQFPTLAEVETLPVSSLDLAFLQAALKQRGQVNG